MKFFLCKMKCSVFISISLFIFLALHMLIVTVILFREDKTNNITRFNVFVVHTVELIEQKRNDNWLMKFLYSKNFLQTSLKFEKKYYFL